MTPMPIDSFESRVTNHDVAHRSNELNQREIELNRKQTIIDDARVKLEEVLGNAVQAAEKQATEINLQRAACRREVDKCIKMCVQSDEKLYRTNAKLLKSKDICSELRENIKTIHKENADIIMQHSQQCKDFRTRTCAHNDKSNSEKQKLVESHDATRGRLLKKMEEHHSEIQRLKKNAEDMNISDTDKTTKLEKEVIKAQNSSQHAHNQLTTITSDSSALRKRLQCAEDNGATYKKKCEKLVSKLDQTAMELKEAEKSVKASRGFARSAESDRTITSEKNEKLEARIRKLESDNEKIQNNHTQSEVCDSIIQNVYATLSKGT
jgi:hypothetical protein